MLLHDLAGSGPGGDSNPATHLDFFIDLPVLVSLGVASVLSK